MERKKEGGLMIWPLPWEGCEDGKGRGEGKRGRRSEREEREKRRVGKEI